MDEAEVAVSSFVVASCKSPGVFELVEAAFDHVAQGIDGGIDRQQNLPEKFWKEELAVLGAALDSKSGAVVVSEIMVEASLKKIFENMTEVEVQAIAKPPVSNRIDVCNATIKMYEAIEKMPPTERVRVGRYLFGAA